MTYDVEGADRKHFDITAQGVLSIEGGANLLGATWRQLRGQVFVLDNQRGH